MKLCPLCKNRYTDDTLAFCLQDGTPLVDEHSESSVAPTAVLHDAETIAAGPHSGRIDVEVTRDDDERETRERIPRTMSQASARRPGTLWTVVGTVAVMLLLFGIAGSIGLVYYFSGKGGGNVQSSNSRTGAQFNESPTPGRSPSAGPSASPRPSAAKTSQPSPTIDEEIDAEAIKGAVGQRLRAWKAYTERLDLNGLMSCYADTLSFYYNRGRTGKDFVRTNKGNALAKFERVSITITDLVITAGPAGRSATAVFDKEWRFEGSGRVSTGKVRARLAFTKAGDEWLISGEKDLKVYYTRSS